MTCNHQSLYDYLLTHTNETKNFCLSNHIKDVIGFHSSPPSNFKKEDVALLHHNSTNIHKIIFGQDIAETWRFKPSDKVSIIEYGIPRSQVACDSYENRNGILILNLENSQQIQMLYNNISASIPNVDIINSNNISIENLDQMLLKYDLCIDFGNKINVLYCISRGIKCITPLEIDSMNLIYRIYDYKNIIDIIKQVLSIKLDNNTRIKSAEKIIDQYDYETFRNKLITKLQQVKNEIFKP